MPMMGMCNKCTKMMGVLLLVLGLIFLVVDLEYWNFFGIQWWTALFLLMGVAKLGHGSCAECQAVSKGKK